MKTWVTSSLWLAGAGFGTVLGAGFGWGLNSDSAILGLFVFAFSLFFLLSFPSPSLGWALLRLALLAVLSTAGFFLAFSTSFVLDGDFSSAQAGLMIGICFAYGLTQTLAVFAPFLRIWRRFLPDSNALGVALLGLVFATLLTAFWFLMSLIPFVGDFAHPAYSQVGFKPLMMFASAFGISGVLFTLAFGSFALCLFFLGKETAGKRHVAAWIAIGLLLFATSYGTAATIAANNRFYQMDEGTDPSFQNRVLCLINANEELTITAMASDRNYAAVLWSEESIGIGQGQQLTKMIELSKTKIIGAAYYNSTGSNNEASLLANGKVQYVYKKRHPVPFAEVGTVPGPGIIYSAATSMGNIAMAICFDLCFPWYISSALPRSTDILFQPSETWGSIGKWHAKINAVRSIENGVMLIRCSSDSFSGAFMPSGEWRAFVSDEFSSSYEFLVHRSFSRVWTLYTIVGESFALICCAFALLYLVFLFAMPLSVLDKMFGRIARRFLWAKQRIDTAGEDAPLLDAQTMNN